MARGAASALQRSAQSAFDAGSGNGLHHPDRTASTTSTAAGPGTAGNVYPVEREYGSDGRIRKRDVIGNMVTGGLVSGMSWVLGAPATSAEAGTMDTTYG